MEQPTIIIRGKLKTGTLHRPFTYLTDQGEMTPREICTATGIRLNTFYAGIKNNDILKPNFIQNAKKEKKKDRGQYKVKSGLTDGDNQTPDPIKMKNLEYYQALKQSYRKGGMSRICNGRTENVVMRICSEMSQLA